MGEREPRSPEPERDEPFWQEDLLIGEVRLRGQDYSLRMKAHTSHENHYGRTSESLFTPTEKRGERVYLMSRFSILVPDIRVTIAFQDGPDGQPVAGRVVSSAWEGMREEEIAAGQAWFYPNEDRTAILWEILPRGRYYRETDDPTTDDTLKGLWKDFESHVVERWQPKRILTPSWEPLYDTEAWRWFLKDQGYTQATERAFMKEVSRQ